MRQKPVYSFMSQLDTSLIVGSSLLSLLLCLKKKKSIYLWLHWVFIAAGEVLSSRGARAQLPSSVWGLSSSTRDQNCVPCIGSRILNHWTRSKVPPLTS